MFALVTTRKLYNTRADVLTVTDNRVKWTNQNVVVVAPATIPQDKRSKAQPVKMAAPVTKTVVVIVPGGTQAAPAETLPYAVCRNQGTVIYRTPQWEGLDIYGKKITSSKQTPHSTQVISSAGWIVSEPTGFPVREISPEWYAVPYHHPISGATITADNGKVTMRIDDACDERIAYLADRFGKFIRKTGYVFTFKKFADFMHCKTNGGLQTA